MAQNIVKKSSFTEAAGTTDQLLGLAYDLCANLPQAIGLSSETSSACVAAKMGELSAIQNRMASATAEEMPGLIKQSEAAYRELNKKDVQNKVYGFVITLAICGAIARAARYALKAAKAVV